MWANEPEMAEKWSDKEKNELDEKELEELKVMKITKNQLRKLIREEKGRFLHEQDVEVEEVVENGDHHWPRVDWTNVEDLVDLWADMELKAWEPDPSSTKDGELSNAEAKDWFEEQLESATMDLEAELTVRVRKLALSTMKEFTERLMNGEYDR